jgi:hypothetical protein
MDVDRPRPKRKDPHIKAKLYGVGTSVATLVMLVEALGAGAKWR